MDYAKLMMEKVQLEQEAHIYKQRIKSLEDALNTQGQGGDMKRYSAAGACLLEGENGATPIVYLADEVDARIKELRGRIEYLESVLDAENISYEKGESGGR